MNRARFIFIVLILLSSAGCINYEHETYLKEDKANGKDGELFKGFKFKYVLHMPQDIVSANTDRIDKNTATWELPLDAIANNKDFYITASMKGQNKLLRWLTKFKKK